MKTQTQSGAALVLVLSLVVILSVLLVTFLSRIQSGSTHSGLVSNAGQARQLAQRAVDEVITRVYDATTRDAEAIPGQRSTWTSQPGMIRVFDASGDLVEAVRLYSATDATVASDVAAAIAADVPANWDTRKLDFVNLNAPTASGSYPIIDPNASFSAAGLTIPSNAPMPVRWLYVQSDGTIGTEVGSNPVGRIAFWADDESCKVNINTAADGTPINNVGGNNVAVYDLQRSGSNPPSGQGGDIARRIPLANEFHMQPGHPASVSLAGVFGTGNSIQDYVRNSMTSSWGGSENANRVTFESPSSGATNPAELAPGITQPPLNEKPLAASTEEWLFGDQFNVDTSGRERQNPLFAGSPAALTATRFLTTVRNPSSTLSLFGTPRVSIWPLASDPNLRSNYDQRMALASTYGDSLFAFQRADSKSATDATGISRNFEILESLESKLSTRPPGFDLPSSTTFASKYGPNETRQILTNIFDFIRIANLDSPTPDEALGPWRQTNGVRARESFSQTARPESGGTILPEESGIVVPVEIPAWNTRGFGRAPIVSEVIVQVFRRDDETDLAEPLKLGVALYFELAHPVSGLPITFPIISLETGIAQFTFSIGGTPYTASFSGRSQAIERRLISNGNNLIGGTLGMAPLVGSSREDIHDNALTYAFYADLPDIDKASVPTELVCTGGRVEFTLSTKAEESSAGNIFLQEYEIDFEPFTAPFPETWVASDWQSVSPESPWNSPPDAPLTDLADRFATGDVGPTTNGGFYNRFFPQGDVVRSMELRDGDFRTIATQATVSADQFAPSAAYADSARSQSHTARFGRGRQYSDLGVVSNIRTPGRFFGSYGIEQTAAVSSNNLVFGTSDGYDIPSSFSGGLEAMNSNWARDFDNTLDQDGGLISKPYEHNGAISNVGNAFRFTAPLNSHFAPHFQMPSPVAFGTLPSGAYGAATATTRSASTAWRTLNFAPKPIGPNSGTHLGLESPPDYVLLDLFEMPVVMPRAITVPGSTEGRVNLNQQMIPFTNFQRTTALHAALSPQRMALNPTQGPQRKVDLRFHRVNPTETIRGIAQRWEITNDVYRSPAEICSIFMIPMNNNIGNPDYETVSAGNGAWWDDFLLTSDSMREHPYSRIYPLLTTQSNTFKIHILAQTLGQGFAAGATQANGGDSFVTGQWGGAVTIERYLSPSDMENLATESFDFDNESLHPYHRFRVISVEPN